MTTTRKTAIGLAFSSLLVHCNAASFCPSSPHTVFSFSQQVKNHLFHTKQHVELPLLSSKSTNLASHHHHSPVEGEPSSNLRLKVQGFKNRRHFLSEIASSIIIPSSILSLNSQPSNAGEVGAKINQAVTQSDLGISVRRSVVRGAQIMDKIDGSWEKFSDNFGLGYERSKREALPKPKEVPDPLPLDERTARSILDASDSVFLSIVSISEEELKDKISKVDALVRKSFERAGLNLDDDSLTAAKFNFYCYTHFKAFNEVLVEKKINFNQFRKKFENDLGSRLVDIIVPKDVLVKSNDTGSDPDSLKKKLVASLAAVDKIMDEIKSKGLVALVERNELDSEVVDDWSNDLSDLQFSIPIDGDITMNAQILLQEQGYRLYPDFNRFAITSALRKGLQGTIQEVTSEEYYMDTAYSSDPDKFEAKQVLLNVVIESV